MIASIIVNSRSLGRNDLPLEEMDDDDRGRVSPATAVFVGVCCSCSICSRLSFGSIRLWNVISSSIRQLSNLSVAAASFSLSSVAGNNRDDNELDDDAWLILHSSMAL